MTEINGARCKLIEPEHVHDVRNRLASRMQSLCYMIIWLGTWSHTNLNDGSITSNITGG